MGSTERVRKLLLDRIEYYRNVHGITETEPFESPAGVEEAIFDSVQYPQPYSTYSIVFSLLWVLDHHHYGDGCLIGYPTDEYFVIIVILECPCLSVGKSREADDESAKVSAEENADLKQTWREEFSTWPVEDCRGVFEWLQLAQTWGFPGVWDSERAANMMEYWSYMAAGQRHTEPD